MLKSLEVELSVNDKKLLLEKFALFGQDDPHKSHGFWGDTSGVYYLHLNEDSFIDIIYINDLGLYDVLMYFGTKNGFKLALAGNLPNDLKSMRFESKKCVEVILETTPYIDASHSEAIYKLVQDSFELQYVRHSRDYTEQPFTYYSKPLYVKTKIDFCPLRENPTIAGGKCPCEDPEPLYNKSKNIVYQFKKETTGYCWAEKRDEQNILWFLVDMPLNQIVPNQNHSEKEYFVGWMQATHLDF
jgi:hypothetical protein